MYRMLIVDDEKIERTGLCGLVRRFGYPFEIFQAANGKQAVQLLGHTEVDVLITDIRMPLMDGLELTDWVRKNRPAVHVVIASAYGDFAYAQKAISMQVRDYLLKPVDLAQFQTMMEHVQALCEADRQEADRARELEEYHRMKREQALWDLLFLPPEKELTAEAAAYYEAGFGQHWVTPVLAETHDPFFGTHEEEFTKQLAELWPWPCEVLVTEENQAVALVHGARPVPDEALEAAALKLLEKLRRVCIAAGIKDIDMDGRFVAIKMHFGELGNLAFLRPNYAKVVADLCKEQGGQPFLTDCNTLYPGSRKNALEHLSCAQENGFWPMTTGCQIIIGDGLRGTDELEVPVPNGEYCKTAKIGRAIMDADVFISLTHFKGHESTGFGGALKNIGMGCGSRAGKMEQHAAGKPAVQEGLCRGCHRCAKECGSDAITYNAENKAVIDYDKCKGCGRCIGACSFDAIYSPNDCANELLDRKMAEYAAAVCHDRPCFHISLVQDISPNCDCHGENDAPILPDIGIFASFDPVALDQACVDACLNAAPLPNSQLSTNLAKPGWNCYHDNFKDSNPNIEWKATLEQAEKVGMGTRQYVLKKV